MESKLSFPDEDARPFWEGAGRNQLMIQQCADCRRYIFYPRAICPHCFSEAVSWVESPGKGRIYSYTVVHQSHGRMQTPYVVGLIELEEGVRIMARMAGETGKVTIHAPVQVHFEKGEDEMPLPVFTLSSDG